MANEIKNEDSFDHILDNLAQGFGHADKVLANEAGAKVFVETMKPNIRKSNHLRKGEKVHLRDALLQVPKPNGSVHIGFTSASNKGYIGRFQNDGWTPKDRNGDTHTPVPGQHFWEKTQVEAKGVTSAAIAKVLKTSMDRKVRGGE